MTMDGMVKYLKEKGFEVTKHPYDPRREGYDFTIKKDVNTFSDFFKYSSSNVKQKCFLDNLIENFYKIASEYVPATPNLIGLLAGAKDVVHIDIDGTHIPIQITEIKRDCEIGAVPQTYLSCEVIETMYTGEGLWPRRSPFICNDTSVDIVKVIFNDPATIVFWDDGSKTIVKCQEGDVYDPEKGLAMAICKKTLGNQGNYCNELKKWLPEKSKPAVPHSLLLKAFDAYLTLNRIRKMNRPIKADYEKAVKDAAGYLDQLFGEVEEK